MKKCIPLIIGIIAILSGCATQLGGYKFSMMPPPNNPNKYVLESEKMGYADDNIVIVFMESKTWYMGVDGMSQYDNYEGLSFTLNNKTNEVLTIDWNKVSFKDYAGRSGNAVMHQGIKYNECNSLKAPTTIPPNGVLSDIIIPCYGLNFISSYGARWQAHMLPNPTKIPNINFGVLMPMQIGDKLTNYEFNFKGVKAN